MNLYERLKLDAPRNAAGLVLCDDPDCTAKEDPQTLAEALDALEHWRIHHYSGGCSHGG